MRLSTLRLNKNFLVFTIIYLIILSMAGCTLDPIDGTDDGTATETEELGQVSITIPTSVYNFSRAVTEVEISRVSLSVRRSGGSEDLISKIPDTADESGNFVIDASVPVNTLLELEAFGLDAAGEVVAYGKRTLTASATTALSAAISLSLYQPANLPIVKFTNITVPPAASQNSMFNYSVDGYVNVTEWPNNPSGEPIPTISLTFSTQSNGADSASVQTSLSFSDAESGRISFEGISLTALTDSNTAAAVTLSSEIIPGGTLLNEFSVDLMPAVSTLTASGSDNRVDLSWVNPSGTWFDGVVLVSSTSVSPQSAAEGTELYRGTGTGYAHTGLTNGINRNYTVFPYTESSGTYYYGPAAYISSTPADTLAPGTPSSFAALESNGNVSLSWTNPGDADLAEIIVLKKSGSYAASVSDSSATTVYSGGTGTSASDSLASAGTWYYSVYARDDDTLYSSPAQSSVTYAPVTSGYASWGYNYGELTTSDSISVSSSSKYADVWVFTLSSTSTVQIGLNGYYGSRSFDTYLYLYSGATPSSSNRIAYNDDSGFDGYGLNSYISRTLGPGTYSIEASHYGYFRTGDYRLYLNKY